VQIELLSLLKGKDVLVGVIDVASDVIETPEQVKETIFRALKYVPAKHLFPCTNCGMAPMAREVALAKLKALGEGAALARKKLTSAAGRRAGKASPPSSRRGTASSRRRR
jgi:5-methyltetrahydropteroyltriglutamate--homocysteine methyltransferase